MARTLNKSKPFVEVFGDVDENEKDKEGNAHVPHRYRQYGMMFDEAGDLIGEEKEVPPDHETEDQMRERIERELRVKIEQEYRDKAAERAKNGGGDGGAKANAGDSDDLPGNLGKGDAQQTGSRRKAA